MPSPMREGEQETPVRPLRRGSRRARNGDYAESNPKGGVTDARRKSQTSTPLERAGRVGQLATVPGKLEYSRVSRPI
jgi:hypothetical protein